MDVLLNNLFPCKELGTIIQLIANYLYMFQVRGMLKLGLPKDLALPSIAHLLVFEGEIVPALDQITGSTQKSPRSFKTICQTSATIINPQLIIPIIHNLFSNLSQAAALLLVRIA